MFSIIQTLEISQTVAHPPKGLDLLSLFRISKLLKQGATAIVLKAVAEDHEQMDKTPFVLRLKDDDCPPSLVRSSQVINYRLALGQQESLQRFSRNSVLKSELEGRIALAVALLREDLKVPIRAKSGDIAAPLSDETISKLKPFDGLPDITSEDSLAGLMILSVGSGFGSAIQARRQYRNFSLHGGESGGAQYLNSFGSLKEQLPNLRAKNAQIDLILSNEDRITEAASFVARTMNRLTKEFNEQMVKEDAPTTTQVRQESNVFYKALGFGFLGLAIAGYSLPVMPGTVFLICSAYCFSRSSPRMSQWLEEHPKFGPTLKSWRESKAITKPAKLIATSSIALSSIAIGLSSMPYKPLALLFLLGSAAYILSRPTSK